MLRNSTKGLFKSVFKRSIFGYLEGSSKVSKPILFPRQRAFDQILKRNDFAKYFKSKEGIPPNIMDTINLLGQFDRDIKHIDRQLSKITDTHMMNALTFHSSHIFLILVALYMNGSPVLLNKYQRILFQYLLRRDIEELNLDQQTLHCLLETFISLHGKIGQKKKQSFVMFHVLTLVQKNLDLLSPSYYEILLELLKNLEVQCAFFVNFVRDLQKYILPIVKQAALAEGSNQKVYVSKRFLLNLLPITQMCHCSKEMAETLLLLADKYIAGDIRDGKHLNFVFKFFKLFPYRERDSEGVFLKRKLLDKLHVYLDEIEFLANSKEYYILLPHYCSLIVHFIFYERWMNLIFTQKGDLIYLLREDLNQPPALPQLFWEIYKKNIKEINSNIRLKATIRDCYPEHYIHDEGDKKDLYEPIFDSEIKMRMEMVLTKMGLNYQKEVNLSCRYIDFYLPEEGIVIELDGSVHFHPEFFEYDDKSVFKIIHMLYAGYKLLMINYEEYNTNREVPQLMALFENKLNQIREENCVAVL